LRYGLEQLPAQPHKLYDVSANLTTATMICSYQNNYYLDTFTQHVEEMFRTGFKVIVLCVTEEGLKYNKQNLSDFVEVAHKFGLEVWADSWGVAGLFDGEAGSTIQGPPCLCNRQTHSILKNWLAQVEDMAFDKVFLDNPKVECKICSTLSVIDWITSLSRKPCVVCLSYINNQNNPELYAEVAALDNVVEIGTDPYYLGQKNWSLKNVTEASKLLLTVAQKHGKLAHIWVQGFGLPEGCKALPVEASKIAISMGISRIAFWSFRACEATSSIRSKNYKEIWELFKKHMLSSSSS
jgi:hypothetical protein